MINGIKRNYVIALAVAVGVIIIGVATTYAYFQTQIVASQDGGPDFVATSGTSSVTGLTLTQIHGINSADKRPGYKDVLVFSATASSSVNFNLNMTANSTLETGVGYSVYKTTSQINATSTCSDVDAEGNYSANCSITNLASLGTALATGTITSSTSQYELLTSQSLSSGTVYYYIVLDYPNEAYSQDADFFKALTATVSAGAAPRTLAQVLQENDTQHCLKSTNNAENGDTIYYYDCSDANNYIVFGEQTSDGLKVWSYYDDGYNYNTNLTPAFLQEYLQEYGYEADGLDTYSNGDEIYWRIIRTNEASTGGGIRLLYLGSATDEDYEFNSKSIGVSQYGPSIGYTYNQSVSISSTGNDSYNLDSQIRGNQHDSTVKTFVDDWYEDTFLGTNYANYINRRAVYCNDKSISGIYGGESYLESDSEYGYYHFGSEGRFGWLTNGYPYSISSMRDPASSDYENYKDATFSFACGASNEGFGHWYTEGNKNADRYTADSYSLGNGWLDYPIALPTADDLFVASKYYTSSFLYTAGGGVNIWTMSPANDNKIIKAGDGYSTTNPYINLDDNKSIGVAPVISLKNDVQLTGTGTLADPYRVVMD